MITSIGRDPRVPEKMVMTLGFTRENIERLAEGQGIRVDSETHPGFPVNLRILVVFGETHEELTALIQPYTTAQTKVVVVPRGGGGKEPS